ncbi:hypothetical protein HQQ94_10710 [Shewanella sp. VB17]|uniref:hypothetical protein n=1 Tax=Shewanella sp. VB17 TaxID=2739432 RepID=UPI0015634925|nr:hypothetical protein [Shewanella sp. VB17]NRD73702.1 hypothetical protein [Shewanella sp. VB17]
MSIIELATIKSQSKKQGFAFNKGVDTAASFGFKDETVKRPWMASQRLAEVSTHRPTAGD